MAVTTKSDFVIYDAEFQSGMWEGLAQVIDLFNAPSRNTIRLVQRNLQGDFLKEAFFKRLSGMIERRDPTTQGTATAKKIEQAENVGVKLNRRFGPISSTLDAFRKIARNPSEFSFMLGKWYGQEKAKDMLNTGVIALDAALTGITAINFDATGESTPTITASHMVDALALMGDMASRVVAWVMHSGPFFELVKDQITANQVVNIANIVIANASPVTLNRPVIMSDIPALHDANGSATDTYNILGLVEDAVVVTEAEDDELMVEPKTGGTNLEVVVQGELAYVVGVKGCAWDATGAGANPTDAALGNSSNWNQVATSVKDGPGVRIVVNKG